MSSNLSASLWVGVSYETLYKRLEELDLKEQTSGDLEEDMALLTEDLLPKGEWLGYSLSYDSQDVEYSVIGFEIPSSSTDWDSMELDLPKILEQASVLVNKLEKVFDKDYIKMYIVPSYL